MPLQIVRDDITNMKVDAIVAAGSAHPGMPAPTGGVNGRIHQRAGFRLLEALRRRGGIRTAKATLTEAYDLPCRYVIHTAGPQWRGGSYGEETLLRACYREALQLAEKEKFESIAFPLISTGKYGYPKEEALRVAADEIRLFLETSDIMVWLVVYDREAFRLSGELFEGVEQFIDQHYVDEHYVTRRSSEMEWAERYEVMQVRSRPVPSSRMEPPPAPGEIPEGLVKKLSQLDESFALLLQRLIDQRGMKDSECYRRANVDRKVFSKIRNTPGYTPKKQTVIAFCAALELSYEDTCRLLARAGYGMSRASKFDVIIKYFFERGVYDVHAINQVLWHYDQPLLGSCEK